MRKYNIKKIAPIAILLTVIIILIYSTLTNNKLITVVKGNIEMKPLAIKINKTNDVECGMLIKTNRNAAQTAVPDGRTWFFDSLGCLVLWMEDKDFKDDAKYWVYAMDAKRWIDAREAYFTVADMEELLYGFGAREKRSDQTINFKEMRLRMLRGEHLGNIKMRKKLLGNKYNAYMDAGGGMKCGADVMNIPPSNNPTLLNETHDIESYKINISSQKPFTVGDNDIQVILQYEDKQIIDAKVKVKFFMPEMPGMPYMDYKEKLKLNGTVYNGMINFIMNGTWQYHLMFKTHEGKIYKVRGSVNL